MINRHAVFEIHRLYHEGLSKQRIAATLHVDPKTVRKFLIDPDPKRPPIRTPSKLDPFREEINRLLAIDARAPATVILQRIAPLGFDGGITILNDYLQTLRGHLKNKEAFIRFESLPGEQCQVDWGHFGSIAYGETTRKLYCLAVLECHSRLLYLGFTHSQRQETLHRCLLNAFRFFKGTPPKSLLRIIC